MAQAKAEKLFEEAKKHIDNDDVIMLQSCFSRGLKAETKDDSHNTLLHYAAKKDNDDIILFLLSCGSPIHPINKETETPLTIALMYGKTNSAKALIDRGINAAAKYSKGKTLLHYAAKSNSREIVNLLISKGCAVNIQDKNNETPLEVAFLEGNEIAACALIDNGADLHIRYSGGNTLLHRIASQNNIAILRQYRQMQEASGRALFGSNYNLPEPMLAHYKEWEDRCSKANPVIADCLLACGVDPNSTNDKGLTVLDCAARSGLLFLVRRLLDTNTKCATESLNAATLAIALSGDCNSISKMISMGATFPDEAVLGAAMSGNIAALDMILDTGAYIDSQNPKGWSALMEACKEENYAMVERLISRGANLNLAEGVNSLAALHIACAVGAANIVSLLLKNGANPNQRGKQDCTPLKVETAKNASLIRQLLIEAGAES